TMLTAVIGAVGPLICCCVEQNKDAKNPIAIAPNKPAAAPIPDCSPKAIASGNATMPEVIPPNKSPLRYLNVMKLQNFPPINSYLQSKLHKILIMGNISP